MTLPRISEESDDGSDGVAQHESKNERSTPLTNNGRSRGPSPLGPGGGGGGGGFGGGGDGGGGDGSAATKSAAARDGIDITGEPREHDGYQPPHDSARRLVPVLGAVSATAMASMFSSTLPCPALAAVCRAVTCLRTAAVVAVCCEAGRVERKDDKCRSMVELSL
jgi:hypothetical protein